MSSENAEISQTSSPEVVGSQPWSTRIEAVLGSSYAWLMRPRIRLAVVGGGLLLVGGLVMTSSVWTLPLVIVGVAMVVVAWIGHRLDGRFTVEWGDAGTQLLFRATIKPPSHRSAAVKSLTSPDPADVIEGEAHTVEIDVAELKALIAAAESGEEHGAQGRTTEPEIRVSRIHAHEPAPGQFIH
jgi:hypothetical protein